MKKILLLLVTTILGINSTFSQIQYPRVTTVNSITLSGRGDFSDVKDQGKIYRFIETTGSDFKIRAYIKSFNYYNINSKAGVMIRDASSAQEADGTRSNYGLFCKQNKIVFQSRAATQAVTTILKSIDVSLPCWLELEKQGTTLYARYSLDGENSVPTFTSIQTVLNAFTNYTNFTKALAVSSGTNSIYSNAVFTNYIASTVTNTNCNQAPTILSVVKNIGENKYKVTYSASGVTGFNYSILDGTSEIKVGSTTSIANNSFDIDLGSSILSDKSYTLKVSATNCAGIAEKTFTGSSCALVNGTKIGTKTISPNSYDLYARTFNGKIWLVQILSTDPESFSVRGVNITQTNFVKSWTGNDFSCFQGQTTAFGGMEEPSGFTTPLNYTLSTVNGNKIYTAVTPTLASCLNGGVFNITDATALVNGSSYNISYNAANLTSARVLIKSTNGSIINSFIQTMSPQSQTINFTTLIGGNYTIQLTGLSCNGISNAYPFTVNVLGNDGAGAGQTSFVNFTKKIQPPTILGDYDPDAVPSITVINSIDQKLNNKEYPNWAIGWKVEGGNFTDALVNRKTQNVGIPFMYDINSSAYKGYGVNGVDFVYTQNPNTGCLWGQTRNNANNCVGTPTDTDPSLAGDQYNAAFGGLPHTYQNFASAIPFQLKAGGGHGIAGDGERNRWLNATLESGLHFDDGQLGGTPGLGLRDWVNRKSNVGLSDADIEIGVETGEDGSNKHLAYLLGFGMKTQGYAFSQYSAPLNTVYIDPSKYPNNSQLSSSTYPLNTQLINGVDGEPNSGNTGTRVNNIPTSNDWNGSNKISIPNRFTGLKGILDVPNVIPCIEIASYASATFRQGDIFYYDQNNPSLSRTINKFGLNANTDHVIARVIFAGETNKWYVNNKLDGRKVILQSKITCDAGTFGTLNFDNGGATKYHNKESLRFAHFNREYGFDIGAFTAMNGCEWNIWDRNDQGHDLDGYHGAFGIINLLYQRKKFDNEAFSFVDLKPKAKFLLWDSEISYDDGTNYIKDKANEYVMTASKVPQRQFITPEGYWGGFLARPENTEGIIGGVLTSIKLRVSFGGTFFYHTITPDMWETVDYNERNTALSALPLDKKDYYYFLIKLSNSPGVESSYVTPPSISPNITNPAQGESVTLTSTGCQSTSYVNKWYENSEGNYLSSGLTLRTTAVAGSGFYAKCEGATTSSTTSNIYTFTGTTKVEVNVFAIVGESNGGTRNEANTLLSGESGLRAGVKIWNNNTNTLQQLNIGVNNYYDETDGVVGGWGMENQLANLRANGTLNKDFVIVKTAQGGAFIGNYNSNITPHPNYFDKMKTRIEGTKAALLAEGKTPIFYVLYTQGLNNAFVPTLKDEDNFPGLSGITYWKAATRLYSEKLRVIMGPSTKICYMKFFPPYADYLNDAIQEIVNENPNNSFITTSDLGSQINGVHFDANGTKTIANRYIASLGVVPIVPPSASVVITEPTRAANYYKSSSSNTEIIPTYYLNADDNVYLQNDKVKVGFSLRGGGAITYLSEGTSTLNIVNNANDGGIGRQIQPDYYQSPSSFNIPGKQMSPYFPANGYNTTLGGDDFRNVATLLDYHAVTNGYWIKFKPLIWGINGHISEITIEVTYVLVGNTLQATYKYTSARTDNQIITPDPVNGNTVGQALPAIYLNKFFTQVQSYEGSSPWNNGVVTTRTIPTNFKDGTHTTLGVDATEKWTAIIAPTKNLALGVYTSKLSYVRSERRNFVNENIADDKDDACTIVEVLDSPKMPDSHNSWTRTDNVYFTLGTVAEIRAKAYEISGSGVGVVTTPSSTSTSIIQPDKPAYHFSNNQAPSYYNDRSRLPATFINGPEFNPTDDVVYIQNSLVKYGINLKRGGQLCYASLTGSIDNLVFNGYDGGFQVQLDATQILDPANINGQTSGSPQNNTAYNTTMGGDWLNRSQTLIDYHPITNGYYVKFRPLLYPFNNLIAEVEIEATYTLVGRALKVEYKYTSFRSDGHFPLNPEAPTGFKGWAVPVCFLVEKLNRYQTYTGTSPWTYGIVESGSIPNSTPGQGGSPIMGKDVSEFWGLSYNSNDNVGLGVMNLSEGGTNRHMRWEQRDKYAGNGPGTVFGNGGRTVMDILTNVLVPNGGNFQKTTTAYIAIGSPTEIRSSFYTQAGY